MLWQTRRVHANLWEISLGDKMIAWPTLLAALAGLAIVIWLLSKIGRVLFKLLLVAVVVVVVWSIASGTDLREVFG